jgi:hypothetical protein
MNTVRAVTPVLLRLAFPVAALALLAASTWAAPFSETDASPERPLPVESASLFPDAPDGVDPVVTGPVSAGFRKTQEAFACDRAIWPNVPAACYPD